MEILTCAVLRTGRDARKVQILLIFKDLIFWSRLEVAINWNCPLALQKCTISNELVQK